jgi:3,4-dihydroxy 2-butanone 4-phosphate synthase/GTP cyclohydrolase II
VLETRFGPVEIHAFEWHGEQPYVALRHVAHAAPTVHLRLQAQCLTSTAFAAVMCDCGMQIESGVRMAVHEPGAILVYLPQEGRGHGLLSKVEIMARMNQGMTLRAAQHAVGRPAGRLSYHRVAPLLRHLEVTAPVNLVTGSEQKAEAVRSAGIPVAATVPLRW